MQSGHPVRVQSHRLHPQLGFHGVCHRDYSAGQPAGRQPHRGAGRLPDGRECERRQPLCPVGRGGEALRLDRQDSQLGRCERPGGASGKGQGVSGRPPVRQPGAGAERAGSALSGRKHRGGQAVRRDPGHLPPPRPGPDVPGDQTGDSIGSPGEHPVQNGGFGTAQPDQREQSDQCRSAGEDRKLAQGPLHPKGGPGKRYAHHEYGYYGLYHHHPG